MDADEARLLDATGGQPSEVARVPIGRPLEQEVRERVRRFRKRRTILRLGPVHGLSRTLDLPLAARSDIDQMLRFEMDRLTPFRSEEVYFAHHIIREDLENRKLEVELQLAPRERVDRALELADGLGLAVQRVELEAVPTGSALNLMPVAADEGGGSSALNRLLLLILIGLSALAVWLPLERRRSEAEALQRQVEAARAEAEVSLALREELDGMVRASRFVIDRKTAQPRLVEILAELTRIVPDDAYVQQFYLREGTVQIFGVAAAASDLIGALATSEIFRSPQFRSPVTREPGSGLERFQISVEVRAREETA